MKKETINKRLYNSTVSERMCEINAYYDKMGLIIIFKTYIHSANSQL